MTATGGCYCGAVRYEAEGDPIMQAQCHCRECQYMTGGGPNYFMAFPEAGFKFIKGEPDSFTRTDLEGAVTRLFCPECGTPIGTKAPGLPGAMIVKVGTLDDPSIFQPALAIFLSDKQNFHSVPEGIPAFEKTPG